MGEFVCDSIIGYYPYGLRGFELSNEVLKNMCLSNKDLNEYGKLDRVYGWHISNLKIYDKPKELSEFKAYEKIKCPANLNGNCLVRTQNQVTLCKNLDCEHKELTRPPQSWCYVEVEE